MIRHVFLSTALFIDIYNVMAYAVVWVSSIVLELSLTIFDSPDFKILNTWRR